VVRAERATGAPKARQAESTPAQAEHARWQMVESPGCARSAPLERRRRDGRSARQRRRSTLAQVTGEARIILRCSEAHPQATLLLKPSTVRVVLNCERSHRHSLVTTTFESNNLLSYDGTKVLYVYTCTKVRKYLRRYLIRFNLVRESGLGLGV
jgi:hypothetical protein